MPAGQAAQRVGQRGGPRRSSPRHVCPALQHLCQRQPRADGVGVGEDVRDDDDVVGGVQNRDGPVGVDPAPGGLSRRFDRGLGDLRVYRPSSSSSSSGHAACRYGSGSTGRDRPSRARATSGVRGARRLQQLLHPVGGLGNRVADEGQRRSRPGHRYPRRPSTAAHPWRFPARRRHPRSPAPRSATCPAPCSTRSRRAGRR